MTVDIDVQRVVGRATFTCNRCGRVGVGDKVDVQVTNLHPLGIRAAAARQISNQCMPVGWGSEGSDLHRCPACGPKKTEAP